MDTDVIKLIESKHEVTLLGNNLNEFCVKFYGPRGETLKVFLLFEVRGFDDFVVIKIFKIF
jgi:hypothetical protein